MHGNGKGVGTRPTEISKRHTYVRMCTRSSARHEFSFHGWRDNPSLCHFSSVFLSHRLIELPSPGEIPVTYVLFSVPFFFLSWCEDGKKSRRHRRRIFLAFHRFRRYGTSTAPKLVFFVQSPVQRSVLLISSHV